MLIAESIMKLANIFNELKMKGTGALNSAF